MLFKHIFAIDPEVTNRIYPLYENYATGQIIKPKYIALPNLNSLVHNNGHNMYDTLKFDTMHSEYNATIANNIADEIITELVRWLRKDGISTFAYSTTDNNSIGIIFDNIPSILVKFLERSLISHKFIPVYLITTKHDSGFIQQYVIL